MLKENVKLKRVKWNKSAGFCMAETLPSVAALYELKPLFEMKVLVTRSTQRAATAESNFFKVFESVQLSLF